MGGMLWKDKYELGVPEIDSQHKELFHRVETFICALRSSASWEAKVQQVNETLGFMRGYVVEHFDDEEAFQLQVGYPDYETHRAQHQEMMDYVVAFSATYAESGCDEQLMQQFAGRLLAWLINHVAASDQRMAVFLKEQEVYAHAR